MEAALEQIPRMFGNSQVLDSCFGGAIEAAIEVLKAGTGGKVVAFVATLPKVLVAAAAAVRLGSCLAWHASDASEKLHGLLSFCLSVIVRCRYRGNPGASWQCRL